MLETRSFLCVKTNRNFGIYPDNFDVLSCYTRHRDMHNLFLNNQCQKTLPVKVDQGGQTANQAEDHRERKGHLKRKSRW